MTCATLISQTRHCGSSASILPYIPLFAGFHQSLLHGLEITIVRRLAYHTCVARNGRLVNWTLSCCTIWSHPTEVRDSFETLVALSRRVGSTAVDQRHFAIPSISLAIASWERPARSAAVWYHIWYHIMIWHHIWYNNILYVMSCVISYMCLVTWALIWYHIWYDIILWWYHAPFVIAAARVQNAQQSTRRCRWCISAHSRRRRLPGRIESARQEKGLRRQETLLGGGSQRGSCGSGMKTFVSVSHMISHMISHADIIVWYHSWSCDITHTMWYHNIWYDNIWYDIMIISMIS